MTRFGQVVWLPVKFPGKAISLTRRSRNQKESGVTAWSVKFDWIDDCGLWIEEVTLGHLPGGMQLLNVGHWGSKSPSKILNRH